MIRFSSLPLLLGLMALVASCDVPSQSASVINGLEIFHGDLLFSIEEPSGDGLSDAIATVTEGVDGSQVVHVGIACEQYGRMMVLEATPSHGVWLTPLDKFFEEAEYDDEGNPCILVGRLRDTLGLGASVQRAMQYLGLPYDTLYIPDARQIYCSELVQLSYQRPDGTPIFKTRPMSFTDSSGDIAPYWKRLYAERGIRVPEGAPGTNPADLSRDSLVLKILTP
ncbi:MAG: hypothetical protein IKX25_05970 [Bacteroidales bacterium]|nr:hypothetical protein [Bacteroidales bacterium]